MFKSKVYMKRRSELAEKIGKGVILFLGNDESHTLVRDTVHKFRQDSNFLYYWGLNEPGLAALIDIDNNKEILLGHNLTTDEIVWEGEQQKLSDKAKMVGVKECAELFTLKKTLLNFRKGRRKIHYLPQHLDNNIVKYSELFNIPNNQVNKKTSIKLTKAVINQRSVKSKKEVAEIEQALNITLKLHISAMRRTKSGRYEHEVVKRMDKFLLANCSRWAYLPIFTVRGERLHNIHYKNILQAGQLVVNDAGAESPSGFYASDITRTFPVSGKFSKRQEAIYKIVLKSQLAAIDAIAPGVKYVDVHLLAANIIAVGLKKIGLMKGDTDRAVKAGAHALFFPHGLGHMMGLDVHDMEDLGEDYVGYDDEIQRAKQFGIAYLRLGKALQTGNVLTVEPGIYFIPQLIEQWQKENKFSEFINYDKVNEYYDFGGVRIEDNVLVTKTGCRVLGKPIPKTVKEIEGIMNK